MYGRYIADINIYTVYIPSVFPASNPPLTPHGRPAWRETSRVVNDFGLKVPVRLSKLKPLFHNQTVLMTLVL